MDSVTQLALGSAVGYAVIGNKVGRKAIAWGAFLGTLPDLDVLVPFDNAVDALVLDGVSMLINTHHFGHLYRLRYAIVVAPNRVPVWCFEYFYYRSTGYCAFIDRSWRCALVASLALASF